MLWLLQDATESCGLLILDKPAQIFAYLGGHKQLEHLGFKKKAKLKLFHVNLMKCWCTLMCVNVMFAFKCFDSDHCQV